MHSMGHFDSATASFTGYCAPDNDAKEGGYHTFISGHPSRPTHAIMKHMNMLYECLDAHNNYSAIRQALALEDCGITSFEDGLAHVLRDDVEMQHSVEVADDRVFNLSDDLEGVGAETAKIRMHMSAMTVMLSSVCSQYENKQDYNSVNDITHSFQYQPPTLWKAAVSEAQDAVIAWLRASQVSDRPWYQYMSQGIIWDYPGQRQGKGRAKAGQRQGKGLRVTGPYKGYSIT
ncbi:hypothetical protein BKA93DRAFT_752460 [Sparassis latifolia]